MSDKIKFITLGLVGTVSAVIVLQGATVQDLVLAFQRQVEKICEKEGRTKHLSWYLV